jgi:hypothetical protein
MAITVSASPTTLAWSNFTSVSSLTDPADGTAVDAYTTFGYDIPDRPARTVGGMLALADPMTIRITPNARVVTGVAQTAGLLSHEQFHYDVGIVCARALARHLMRLRGANQADLRSQLISAVTLHLITRAGLIQRRYDIDSRHGTNAHYQKVWKDRMATVLANPNADQIGGFWL